MGMISLTSLVRIALLFFCEVSHNIFVTFNHNAQGRVNHNGMGLIFVDSVTQILEIIVLPALFIMSALLS